MGVKIGSLDISAFKVGSADCKVYLGETLLYPQSQPHDYSQDYFTIVSEADNNTIYLKNTGYKTSTSSTSYWKSVSISSSTDNGSTWRAFSSSRNGTITFGTINKGEKIIFKSNTTKYSNTNSAYHYFDCSGNIIVQGNILSLIYGDNFLSYDYLPSISSKETGRTQHFGCIFKNNTKLKTAENLILYPITLSLKCYSEMFNGCTSLTTAPELPATTLAGRCYNSMFQGCTSLTTAPVLSATTLADYCYGSMFSGCTSLTTAPELPAATLGAWCYSEMFQNCTSLTTAPALSATTLAEDCYGSMFRGCTSLTTAPELPATTLAGSCYYWMFQGCTSLTTAPELPATTLYVSCYNGMFSDCTSLTTAPELPATTLAGSCYSLMFKGCTSLTTAPALSATTLAGSCYNSMFSDCTSLTTAPALPATTLAGSCYSNMFQGCTSLTTAPELPATTLTDSCYFHMFSGCTSLTTAPELPAATLIRYCYNNMFSSCSSLNNIRCYATDISAINCITNWVNGVAASGTFKKPSSMSSWTTGTSGIPSGWAVEDVPILQWVSYSEGDTVPSRTVYGVKLYIDLGDDFEIDFGDSHDGIAFIYEMANNEWTALDVETSEPIDISEYFDGEECYTILFSDLGHDGIEIAYPIPGGDFAFDVQLYI